MKTVKFLFAITLILCTNVILAQKTKDDIANYTRLHIETGEGDNKKSGEGYFISFDMTKDKTLYSSIVVDKKIINNATDIKLFLKRAINGEPSDNIEPYILNFPIKADYIIQDDDENNSLVIIPFWEIYQTLKEKNIKTYEVFFGNDSLAEMKVQLKESDLDKLKKIWEMKIEKYISQKQ